MILTQMEFASASTNLRIEEGNWSLSAGRLVPSTSIAVLNKFITHEVTTAVIGF